jgi:hypothetical protein
LGRIEKGGGRVGTGRKGKEEGGDRRESSRGRTAERAAGVKGRCASNPRTMNLF